MKRPFISIVIPAYNEETNIRLGALDKVMRYMDIQSFQWEVVIVDDGSTDATGMLLDTFAKENKGFTVLHNPHTGKAGTVIAGVMASSGSIILFSDLDQATPISEMEKLLPWFDRDFDVVIGSRNSKRNGAPLLRLLMARGFMMLRTIILGLKGITDTQCGFKAFKRHVAHEIFAKLKLYGDVQKVQGSRVSAGFDIELLFLSKKMGYSIKEVPVEWHYVETRRVMPLKDSWEGFLDIIRIRLNDLRGKYSKNA